MTVTCHFIVDYLEEKREEGVSSRISSNSFLEVMEEAIRTFMNFLKADRENHCQIFAALLRRNLRGSVDATLVLLQKKVNKKVIKYNIGTSS